jgi:hypothetical protein
MKSWTNVAAAASTTVVNEGEMTFPGAIVAHLTGVLATAGSRDGPRTHPRNGSKSLRHAVADQVRGTGHVLHPMSDRHDGMMCARSRVRGD